MCTLKMEAFEYTRELSKYTPIQIVAMYNVHITVLGEEILFALTSESVNVCRATKKKINSIEVGFISIFSIVSAQHFGFG